MIKIPAECYKEFGADLDGCSTQEREGCGACRLAKRVPTNADRIRGMSDEELARNNVRVTYMCEVDYDYEEEPYERWIGVYETSDGRQFDFYESAIEHEIDWLQSPVETEGTE